MSTAKVLIADGFTRSGLAVIRSLGHAELSSVVVASSAANLVFKSRFAQNRELGPDPRQRPREYASRIAEIARAYGVRLVLPVTDAAVAALNKYRSEVLTSAPIALPEAKAVDAVLDKSTNLRIAQRLGIPCPRDYQLGSRNQIPQMVRELGLPLVVKNPQPDHSCFAQTLPFRFAVAHDVHQLQSRLDSIEQYGVTPLCQEFVSGSAQNICVFAVDGDCVAIHQYSSIRRSTHTGLCREIVRLDPKLEEYTRRMISELRWSGVAHVGFIVDSESGSTWYMETNGRFWASVQGSINAGWDFPVWVYQYFVDGKRPEVKAIKEGSRTVYGKGDLQQLLLYLAGGQSPSFYTNPGKLRAILDYLMDFGPLTKSDVWNWRDPWPALYDYWELFTLVVGRIFRRETRA